MKRLAILGGTFDPVHYGHLGLAAAARRSLGLDTVIFMPAGRPWMKEGRAVTAPASRAAMLARATRGRPGYHLSRLEVARPGPSYTRDSLAQVREKLAPEDELYFILSWQTLAELPRWYQPAEVIRLCRLAVAPRPGASRPDLAVLEKALPGISNRVVWLEMPPRDISATGIRRRAARGENLTGLVPPAVAAYIREQGLYGAGL